MTLGHWRMVAGALLLALGVGACGSGAPPPLPRTPPGLAKIVPSGLVQSQITWGGMARPYLVYVPPGIRRDHPAPLVIVLSGAGDTDRNMVQITQFDPVADAHGFLVAYPEGFEESWNGGFCCAGAFLHHIDDLAFIRQLIVHLEATYPLDSARVYVTGASNGAIMAYWFACNEAGMVAGVGSVAGAMPTAACHPSRPVPVLEIHGTADPSLPFNGGKVEPPGAAASNLAPSTISVMRRWASLDGCPTKPAVKASGVVSTSTWAPCHSGSEVKLVAVTGAGHVWFAPGFGPVDGAVDATGLIWKFFASHPG
ncbi:MAG: alpha/beta hydrolase family esterase [Acidimicrobiales bacterium]